MQLKRDVGLNEHNMMKDGTGADGILKS